jgi:Zn-dependent protease
MDLIFNMVIVIMSIVVHEVSHGFMALYLGDKTAEYAGRLTLNPIKHLDLWGSVIIPITLALSGVNFLIGWAKPVPFNPYNLRNQKYGEALVAFAGPLSNFAIALFFSLLLRFGLLPEASLKIVLIIIFTNLTLSVFNLIPIPPLDGSKILFTFLSSRFLYLRIKLEKYGVVLVFFFAFFLWQYFGIGLCLIFQLMTGVNPAC